MTMGEGCGAGLWVQACVYGAVFELRDSKLMVRVGFDSNTATFKLC